VDDDFQQEDVEMDKKGGKGINKVDRIVN